MSCAVWNAELPTAAHTVGAGHDTLLNWSAAWVLSGLGVVSIVQFVPSQCAASKLFWFTTRAPTASQASGVGQDTPLNATAP